eukprot:TRINITY_DN4654_c0_g3_i2.p2 TRINITY_DN4654_c0_g3~~TRINITY_DN4654_c0_g3_i2.p2  ORF type:complete len:122 (+),score=45.92 TRINITY_DN4654_c0_g3_i2:776-1141(+)
MLEKLEGTLPVSEERGEDIDLHGKDLGHVIGGYKAALHNPNVSIEAKKHANEMLEKLEGTLYSGSERDEDPDVDLQGKDIGHVIGGYKASLHNPHVSQQAKEHAVHVLDVLDVLEHKQPYR